MIEVGKPLRRLTAPSGRIVKGFAVKPRYHGEAEGSKSRTLYASSAWDASAGRLSVFYQVSVSLYPGTGEAGRIGEGDRDFRGTI